MATLREQLLLATEGVRIADKELEKDRVAASLQAEQHDEAMNRFFIRCDRLQGELGATKEDFEIARNQAQELGLRLSECQERLAAESEELAKIHIEFHPQQTRAGPRG